MLDSKPQSTPMVAGLQLTALGSAAVEDPTFYRSIVGALQYITITRREIAFSVNKVYQFMQNPQEHHWKVVKRNMRYLQGTTTHGLCLRPSNSSQLLGFCDADWGSDPNDRKSTTGYCVYYGSNIIFWSSRKQTAVSRSSTEAEYRGIAVVPIIWIKSLLSQLLVPSSVPIIFCDNLSAVLLSANPVMHSRTKHFKLDLYFVRDKIISKELQVVHLLAQNQVADTLTKPLSGHKFMEFRSKLMVTPSATMSLKGGVKGCS
jgi:histone deacetylase 1/2